MLALDNIKVLDLTTRAPGPFCSMTLSDMGAEVLMIEAPPGTGSLPTREDDGGEVGRAAIDPFRRNKRSIVLNLKDPDAQRIFHDLAKDADVVMEGFRPGAVKRLGVDYETIRAINPRLVYCSISGYGQNGPYEQLPGHDINYISFAGILGSMGTPEGQPVIPNNFIADFASGGLLGAFSILSALWARERTGRGQSIDLSLTDGSMYLMANIIKDYYAQDIVTEPGKMHLNGGFPDYYPYRCKDGKYLSVGALEQKFWDSLCNAIERPDMIPRRRTDPAGVLAELKDIFLQRTRDDWFDHFARVDTAVGKVYTVDELDADPQIKARDMLVPVPGPDGKAYPQVGIAPKLSDTPGKVRFVGAPAGAHTSEVLRELGRSDDDIARLTKQGAVIAR